MEKFFERNPLQVFIVINTVLIGLSAILLVLMHFSGIYNINDKEIATFFYSTVVF